MARRETERSAHVRDPLWEMTDEEAERIVEALEPFVGTARRERLMRVIDARLAGVTLLLDDPYDPHNGAAVVRSAEAFGLDAIHVIERRNTFSVSRAVAMSAEQWVDVRATRDEGRLIDALARDGFSLIATHPRGRLEPRDLGSIARPALVFGNEQVGLSASLREACQESVRIPMRGFVESLNLSVSAAVLLSHATAGRQGDLDAATRRRRYARALVLSVAQARGILDAVGIALGPPS